MARHKKSGRPDQAGPSIAKSWSPPPQEASRVTRSRGQPKPLDPSLSFDPKLSERDEDWNMENTMQRASHATRSRGRLKPLDPNLSLASGDEMGERDKEDKTQRASRATRSQGRRKPFDSSLSFKPNLSFDPNLSDQDREWDMENTTPFTSNTATPAPAPAPAPGPSRPPRGAKKTIEVQIPVSAAARSRQRLRENLEALNGKRKRVVPVDSSDEDDDEEMPDAKLARTLQEEEYLAHSPASTMPFRKAMARKPVAKKPVARKPAKGSRTSSLSARTNPMHMADDSESFTSSIDSDTGRPGPGLGLDGSDGESSSDSDIDPETEDELRANVRTAMNNRRGFRSHLSSTRQEMNRVRLERYHPILRTMWQDLEAMPVIRASTVAQPTGITRQLKPFQLQGLAWMMAMEKAELKGGLLGDEMGLGKTIQAVSLIMSDWPAKQPSLVLVPPVALMQWMSEIQSYTDGTLTTLVLHGTNAKAKDLTARDIKRYNVVIMSYNSLESMYRKQERGFRRLDGLVKEKSIIHQTHFHRVILDEAHNIKERNTATAKACFALKVTYRWCLSGTPLQNRISEYFSLIRFLNISPFASYLCKSCTCSSLQWNMDSSARCRECHHTAMHHVSVFNQELLNPIKKYGKHGAGGRAFRKLRLLTDRIMLRRLKKDHTDAMELPVKEINVERQFFGEVETDFANSIMTNSKRQFNTYVHEHVLLNNYANIFGLIMQMRQVADHPDLLLKKKAEGGQNVVVCRICDETAEDAIRSRCGHDFCRTCARTYLSSTDAPDCPQCHVPLAIDLDQAEREQDDVHVKKSSIINRIKMEKWTSSSKIELLVHELHRLRSDKASHKSIIFSQFTTMLQLIEWRLRRAGITTVMLDGSMTPAQRQASIDHFMTNVDVECFLVSLKAGGVALNLTEASRVFIVDPWWNPAAEWQSADRCHRIGQARPCIITRLCIEDSVESRMVQLQEKKTNMINSTINADDTAMDSLSPEDMQFLFRG